MASRVLPGAPVLICTSSLNTCAPPNTNTTTQHATEVHGRARPRHQRTHWAVPATSPKLYIFAPERILLRRQEALQRRRLGESDPERPEKGHLGGLLFLMPCGLCDDKDSLYQHQVGNDDPRRTHHRREDVLELETHYTSRDRCGQGQVRHPLIGLSKVESSQRAQEGPRHPEEVSPEEPDNGQHRPCVNRCVKSEPEPLLVHAKEVLCQQQMSGTRDRQELRQPLHHAQQNGLDQFKHDVRVLSCKPA